MGDRHDKLSMLEDQTSVVKPTCSHIEISQNRLNVMARQLKLSENRQILLEQHLRAVNILAPDVKRIEYLKFFERNEANTLAFCNNVCGLMQQLGHQYQANDWRLFIDSSKRSLKAALLYRDKTKNPVTLAISSNTRANIESMKNILEKIKYNDNLWTICADLKVISILRGLHLGYTKNMCYLCQWNSGYSDNQYLKRDWPRRRYVRVSQLNVMNEPLVPMEKVLLPPLFIKLGLIKNFVKALIARENERSVHRLKRIFPRLTMTKIKEGKNAYFYYFCVQILHSIRLILFSRQIKWAGHAAPFR